MTVEAISDHSRTGALTTTLALREALRAFFVSRVLVWVSAVLAVYLVPFDRVQQAQHDLPAFTQPLGTSLGSLARWDAIWYLSIAHSGYAAAGTPAFFPLYPLTVRAAAFGIGSSGVLLLASYAVSAACLIVGLTLLHKLVELELGPRFARPALMLVALWPAALFFSAPYSESLFLALSVGMFYAARTDRLALAAGLCAAAAATRPTGLVLILPLAWMAWRARQLRWLAVTPAGALLFSAWLAADGQRPFGWLDVERGWGHAFKGPWGGMHDAAVAGVRGAERLFASGAANRLVAAENLLYLLLLVLALVALVGIFRRLPLEYGLYVAASLLVVISAPVAWQPLLSFGRFLAVLFPIAMWAALRLDGRRVMTGALLTVSSALLVCATGLFATWHLVT
jgi:hypothetical protein